MPSAYADYGGGFVPLVAATADTRNGSWTAYVETVIDTYVVTGGDTAPETIVWD